MTQSATERLHLISDLAKRARRLAQSLSSEADRERLIRYAEDLECQAAELESRAAAYDAPGHAMSSAQVQVQVQQQQQQASDSSDQSSDEKPPRR